MRICAAFLIAGVLTACSSTPLELPTCEIPPAPEQATYPLRLPELPDEISSTDTTATFDLVGMQQLKRYRIASDTNTELAKINAAALEARNASVNALIECTRYQKIWAEIREDMLRQERRAHFVDNAYHRGIIVLGIAAVIF